MGDDPGPWVLDVVAAAQRLIDLGRRGEQLAAPPLWAAAGVLVAAGEREGAADIVSAIIRLRLPEDGSIRPPLAGAASSPGRLARWSGPARAAAARGAQRAASRAGRGGDDPGRRRRPPHRPGRGSRRSAGHAGCVRTVPDRHRPLVVGQQLRGPRPARRSRPSRVGRRPLARRAASRPLGGGRRSRADPDGGRPRPDVALERGRWGGAPHPAKSDWLINVDRNSRISVACPPLCAPP